jgi:hypothetical protein
VAQPIVYIDVSTVRDGKLGELMRSIGELSRFVEAHMPQLLSYGFYLDDSGTTMTVVAVHTDSSSLESHLDTGREAFRKFADLIELERIEVYGHVSAAARDRLHQKAHMLGDATVIVHELHAGFARTT